MATVGDVAPVPVEGAARKAVLTARIARERRAALIINTRSRRGRAMYRDARRLLLEKGFDLAAAYPVQDPTRVPAIVGECVADGHALVIVGGGDGSISAVTDVFADRPVALGILPLGTANSFARSLGIPLDLEGAVDVLATGKVVDVDLGRIDGRTFANAAAIGLQPKIARAVPHHLKRVAGRAGYLLVAAVMLARMTSFRCTIRYADGQVLTVSDALEVRIANGGYKGGVLVAREANPESGDLVVHVVKGTSVLRLAKIWAQVTAGIAPPPDQLEVLRGTTFRIETDPVLYVSIDGEAVAQTPIDVAVARQALCVMAPRDQTALS